MSGSPPTREYAARMKTRQELSRASKDMTREERERRRQLARVAGGVALAVALYLFLLPDLWPEPTGTIEVPAQATFGAPSHVTLTVRAWHPNFEVAHVYLVAEAPRLLPGPGGHMQTLFTFDLYQAPAAPGWTAIGVNRLTWPRSRSFTFALPLAELAEAGLLEGGVLTGRIHATVRYADVVVVRRSFQQVTEQTVDVRAPVSTQIAGAPDSARDR